MQAAFVSQQWSLEIPMMNVVDFFHVDEMHTRRKRWMRHYRELVKRQLLLNGADKIHLSKNPIMSGWVESLIATFPDARFVVMMRKPTDCIPSCLKLVEVNWRSKDWSREACQESLDALTEISFEHFTHPREVLSGHTETRQFVMDYRTLTTAPRNAVADVYAALGLDLESAYDDWLQAQSEREKAHHSQFEYSLGEFRISGEEIHRRLADFYKEYDWEVPGVEETA